MNCFIFVQYTGLGIKWEQRYYTNGGLSNKYKRNWVWPQKITRCWIYNINNKYANSSYRNYCINTKRNNQQICWMHLYLSSNIKNISIWLDGSLLKIQSEMWVTVRLTPYVIISCIKESSNGLQAYQTLHHFQVKIRFKY